MRAISIIFSRELGAYFKSPIGWVIAAAALLLDGLLFLPGAGPTARRPAVGRRAQPLFCGPVACT